MEIIRKDWSFLEGTNCYCSDGSAEIIRKDISNIPLEAILSFGTGDYHYISLFRLELIREPFNLALFDNHPDDQAGAFDADLLSCGSWVAEARKKLGNLKDVFWTRDKFDAPGEGLPVFISLDLDILSTDDYRTNWDQGNMRPEELLDCLRTLFASRRILGMDICGGITKEKGASPEDLVINEGTEKALFSFLAAI